MKTLGIVLLVLGFVMTLFTSFQFFTKEKVVDLGKVEITREKPNYMSWSPAVGIVLMGVGGLVLWQVSRKP